MTDIQDTSWGYKGHRQGNSRGRVSPMCWHRCPVNIWRHSLCPGVFLSTLSPCRVVSGDNRSLHTRRSDYNSPFLHVTHYLTWVFPQPATQRTNGVQLIKQGGQTRAQVRPDYSICDKLDESRNYRDKVQEIFTKILTFKIHFQYFRLGSQWSKCYEN